MRAIAGLGLPGIDLGGLPGIYDHIPTSLAERADDVVRELDQHELRTRAINVDAGAMNDPAPDDEPRPPTGR